VHVKVRYFAAFREAVGTASEPVETRAETAAELFAECAKRYPSLQTFAGALVAVNDEMVAWEHTVTEGDEVLFFPPVAGG
jgi:molybdopterin converting factor subunit 1